jgi:RNA polymerase-binding transcription factor DksA
MKPRRTLDPETAQVMGDLLRAQRAAVEDAVRRVQSHPAIAVAPPPTGAGRPRTLLEEIQAALAQRHTRKLAEIEAALARLGRGEYGLCGDCDEPIGLSRLRALPFAARCARCQSHADLRIHEARRAVVGGIGAGRPAARPPRTAQGAGAPGERRIRGA